MMITGPSRAETAATLRRRYDALRIVAGIFLLSVVAAGAWILYDWFENRHFPFWTAIFGGGPSENTEKKERLSTSTTSTSSSSNMNGRYTVQEKTPIHIQFVMQNIHKILCLSCKKWMWMGFFLWIYTLDDPRAAKFETEFAKRGMQFFDVYSDVIDSRYAEVYWTEQGNLPLPRVIQDKFENGKTIAITGYEHDQVFASDLSVSVPFSWVYNHHYVVYVTTGKMEYKLAARSDVRKWAMRKHGDENSGSRSSTAATELSKNQHLDLHHMGVGMRDWNKTHVRLWVPVDSSPKKKERENFYPSDDSTTIPRSQFISEANGGESRKSLHSYPKGLAQLVYSPKFWHVTPMQVDSRNRKCGLDPSTVGKPCATLGPEPRQARYGREMKNANVSALVECPCTDRFGGDPLIYGEAVKTKSFRKQFVVENCGAASTTATTAKAAQCFEAAANLVHLDSSRKPVIVRNTTVPADSAERAPAGCSVRFVDTPARKQERPAAGATRSRRAEEDTSSVEILFREAAADSLQTSKDIKNSVAKKCTTAAKKLGSVSFDGIGVSTEISVNETHVEMRLQGPATVWFGVAFDAVLMADQPYTILVLPRGSTSPTGASSSQMVPPTEADVVEQQIGTCGEEAQHCPGDRLKIQSLTKLEDRVVEINPDDFYVSENTGPSARTSSGAAPQFMRIVRVVRKLIGASPKHYTFNAGTINLMAAIGRSPKFAHHKGHRRKQVALFDRSADAFNCVCVDLKTPGLLCDSNGLNCESFVKNCAPDCAKTDIFHTKEHHCGDLVWQENPTCASLSYVGGLQCCRHGSTLLDQGQKMDPPDVLQYRVKFRFWYEEYNEGGRTVNTQDRKNAAQSPTKVRPPSHLNLDRLYYQTEGFAGEYDVPPAFRLPTETQPLVGFPDLKVGDVSKGTKCTCGRETSTDRRWEFSSGAKIEPLSLLPSCHCVHALEYRFLFYRKAMRSSTLDGLFEEITGAVSLSESTVRSPLKVSKGSSGAVARSEAVNVLPGLTRLAHGAASMNDQSTTALSHTGKKPGVYLIWANGHCHAPSCLSMELFRNDTGELLCKQTPRDAASEAGSKFGEPGYIYTPPCIFAAPGGPDETVLPRAPLIPDGVPLLSVKKNKNTDVGHLGEMASWQMRAVGEEKVTSLAEQASRI
ncbi:unnamed protein product [Amoebophrya sp. A120]|nr:unnamed protein product [Amoebophrya sp. A120]|eukprot:GSA120T00011466001.1